jgi:uncharacterized protein YdaU (DUF1376 family)
MMNAKSPAFQFYAENFLGGTADMSAEEVGMYIRLLCHQWHRGGLPDDDKKLLLLSGGKKSALVEVKKKFFVDEDGLLKNRRLEATREEQKQYREAKSVAGKHGAEKKWKNAGKRLQEVENEGASGWQSHDFANGKTIAEGLAKDSSSSSPSSSPSTSDNTNNTVIQSTSAEAPDFSKTETKTPIKIRASTSKISDSKEKNIARQKEIIVLPWDGEDFAAAWQKWKDWKAAEYRMKFKAPASELAQLKHLADLSEGNKANAIAIIEQSIGNHWQGLFKIKNISKNQNDGKQKPKIPFWRKDSSENFG